MSHTAKTAHYWDVVVHYLRSAFGLFGEPEQLARHTWFSRKEHKLCCDFLRPLEALIRRLIFIAALELNPMTHPPKPEQKFRARLPSKTNTGAHFDIDNAATWRVRFHFLDRRRPRRHLSASKKKAGGPSALLWKPNFVHTAASAERLEALIRAYKSRDALALKLAHKIAADTSTCHAFIFRPHNKYESKPVYQTLFDLVPYAQEAYQAWIARRLGDTDTS